MLESGGIAIDTNVIVYAFDSDVSNRKVVLARTILRRAGRFPIRMPLQVAAESFSVLTTRMKRQRGAARDIVAQLLKDLPHIPATVASSLGAMSLCVNHGVAFWDALIVAGAAAGGCGTILSEDFQDGRRFGPPDVARRIAIVDPFAVANRSILEAIGALDKE